MMERRQPAARPQHACRLGRSGDRVHPVPGRPRDDRVELPAGRVPVLELRHLDLDPGPPREVSHPRVGVDAEHRAASRLELPGLDAGAAADVQDTGPRAGGDDPVHQGAGVAGPGPVVAFGVRAERLRYLPESMRVGPGGTGVLRRYSGHAPTLSGRAEQSPDAGVWAQRKPTS
jgi:hypothetical protein